MHPAFRDTFFDVREQHTVTKLLVILPHSNIEKTVGALQEKIFRRFGLPSAVALPPVIPIRFVSSPGKVHPLRGVAVRTTSYAIKKRSLYLGVELHVGERMLKSDEAFGINEERGEAAATARPFPAYTGFYLCTAEDESLLPSVVDYISPPPHLDFHPLGLALLTAKYRSDRMWWSHLSWELDGLEKVRKQRG
jgi:hypothetical protein